MATHRPDCDFLPPTPAGGRRRQRFANCEPARRPSCAAPPTQAATQVICFGYECPCCLHCRFRSARPSTATAAVQPHSPQSPPELAGCATRPPLSPPPTATTRRCWHRHAARTAPPATVATAGRQPRPLPSAAGCFLLEQLPPPRQWGSAAHRHRQCAPPLRQTDDRGDPRWSPQPGKYNGRRPPEPLATKCPRRAPATSARSAVNACQHGWQACRQPRRKAAAPTITKPADGATAPHTRAARARPQPDPPARGTPTPTPDAARRDCRPRAPPLCHSQRPPATNRDAKRRPPARAPAAARRQCLQQASHPRHPPVAH